MYQKYNAKVSIKEPSENNDTCIYLDGVENEVDGHEKFINLCDADESSFSGAIRVYRPGQFRSQSFLKRPPYRTLSYFPLSRAVTLFSVLRVENVTSLSKALDLALSTTRVQKRGKFLIHRSNLTYDYIPLHIIDTVSELIVTLRGGRGYKLWTNDEAEYMELKLKNHVMD